MQGRANFTFNIFSLFKRLFINSPFLITHYVPGDTRIVCYSFIFPNYLNDGRFRFSNFTIICIINVSANVLAASRTQNVFSLGIVLGPCQLSPYIA